MESGERGGTEKKSRQIKGQSVLVEAQVNEWIGSCPRPAHITCISFHFIPLQGTHKSSLGDIEPTAGNQERHQ